MILNLLALVSSFLTGLVIYFDISRGGVELLPYAMSKVTLAVLPTTFPSNSTLSAEAFRSLFFIASLTNEKKCNVTRSDVNIDDVVAGDPRLVRIFNGKMADLHQQRDVLIFYFAGAWMLGSVDDNDHLCRKLSGNTNFVVVCAQYSLAPEHPFPRGFNDAIAAMRWTKQNIAQYGGNPNRIYIMGESAGANIASAMTIYNLDPAVTSEEERVNIIGQVLVYPPTAANFTTESYAKYDRYNGMLTREEMQHAWLLYAGGKRIDPSDYRYQPLYAQAALLANLPPTIMVVAEYDVLRDDALHLANRLNDAGVEVDVLHYNTIHGFFGRYISALGSQAVNDVTDRLLKISEKTT